VFAGTKRRKKFDSAMGSKNNHLGSTVPLKGKPTDFINPGADRIFPSCSMEPSPSDFDAVKDQVYF